MRFMKGMLVGGMLATGIALMCADGMCDNKKRMIKKGRQLVRKLGMM